MECRIGEVFGKNTFLGKKQHQEMIRFFGRGLMAFAAVKVFQALLVT